MTTLESSTAAANSGQSLGLSDEAVIARIRSGEHWCFELLMRRHNRRVYRAARAILRRDDEAEDVMQEAYVRAYEHLAEFPRGRDVLHLDHAHRGARSARARADASSASLPSIRPITRSIACPESNE